MRPWDVTKDQMKLRAFCFTLKDKARDWLYYLLSDSITTWTSLKRAFLDMYYLTTKLAHLKKDISSIEQEMGETLYDDWDHFKRLCASFPYHGYSKEDLFLYFSGGLSQEDARMVNSATQGGIIYKTPQEAHFIIERLAKSSRQFFRRTLRRVNALNSSSGAEEQLSNVTSMMRDVLLDGGGLSPKPCELCHATSHATYSCPNLFEEENEEVNAVGDYNQSQRRNDPYSNTYNEGWKNHPNLRYGDPQAPKKQWDQNQNQSPPQRQCNQQG
ncbi:hypothetical protein vseg_013349 [Gypsophila vaccaria]